MGVLTETGGRASSDARQRPSLRNYWHPVAAIDEVASGPAAVTLLDEPLVIATVDGRLVAQRDVCVRCATPLSLGTVTPAGLRCAYDGWAYDGWSIVEPEAARGTRVPGYRVREAYGLIWVCLDEPHEPLPPWPDDMYDDPSFRAFLIGAKVWETSAGRACENAADMSHLDFVHRSTIALPDGPVISKHEVRDEGARLSFDYYAGPVKWEYQIYLPFSLFFKKYSVQEVTEDDDWLSASAPPGGITSISVFASPISETRTKVFSICLRNHSLDVPDDEWAGDRLKVALGEDQPVVESQRPERIPTELREELHLKVPDAFALKYRRRLADILDSEQYLP